MKIAVFWDAAVYGVVEVINVVYGNLCNHYFENLRSCVMVMLFLVNVCQR